MLKFIIPFMVLIGVGLAWLAGGWLLEQQREVAEELRVRKEEFKRDAREAIEQFKKDEPARKQMMQELEQIVAAQIKSGKLKVPPGVNSERSATKEEMANLDERLARLEREISEREQNLEALRNSAPGAPRTDTAGQSKLDNVPTTGEVEVPYLSGLLGQDHAATGTANTPPRPGRGSNAEAINWSADQASGAPDTPTAGDQPTAWASREPDAGEEWLEVQFANWLTPDEIVVVESYNPGAVVRIDVLAANNQYYQVWAGEDPTSATPGELRVPFTQDMEIGAVRVTLDTSKVSGWNEIDAVGAVIGGETHWGSTSEASSSYSEVYPAQDSGENR